MGEVISATALLREIRERSPSIPLYVSVTTVAGRDIAEERLRGLVDGIFRAPIDYAFAVRSVIDRLRPSLIVILETEIWPVLYREAKRAQCGLMIVNGRISDRAFPRYRRWRFFFSDALRQPDEIMVQSDEDARRYVELGAPPHAVHVIGNLKYDAEPSSAEPPRMIRKLIEKLHPSAVWIAASTMAGVNVHDVDEDDAVLRAFEALRPERPGLLLILVPRKPERFDEVERKLKDAGVRYVRRTDEVIPSDLTLPCVVLLDSMGELASLFPLADAVFMGGTLAQRGGHNILEPAAVRRAIVVGPHMENFAAIAAEFRQQGAFLEIREAGHLARAVGQLLDQPELRVELGARAAALAFEKRGATRKAVAEILRQHDLAVPSWNRLSPARILLWAIAKIWELGSIARPAIEDGARAAAGHARHQRRGHQHGRGRENSHGELPLRTFVPTRVSSSDPHARISAAIHRTHHLDWGGRASASARHRR